MNRIKATPWDAVIFDYGGVLSYPPIHRKLVELGQSTGLDEPSFLKLYSNTRDYYGRSLVEYSQHWLQVAEALTLKVSATAVDNFIAMESDLWTRPNTEVVELARAVKRAGLKTAILSNMTFDLLGKLRARLDWLAEFDVQIWSCEEGHSKPGAAIYRVCTAALGCEPGRALFFDDRPRNVEAAKREGVQAHVFESVEQARAILKCGLGLKLCLTAGL
jgi:putative hydrolase of the HAD superfamily